MSPFPTIADPGVARGILADLQNAGKGGLYLVEGKTWRLLRPLRDPN